jgi:arylsulfatase
VIELSKACALAAPGTVLSAIALLGGNASAQEVLPVSPAPFKGQIGLSVKDSKSDFPKPIEAPKGEPNIVLILLDDVGYGASSTFGGPISTPTLERLAQHGLRYTQFHTAAICSPTRAALLTGRNHHSVHTGNIMELATGFPGYDSLMGKDTATIAEILRQKGWNTAWFGKNHNVPDWQSSQAGPFDLWPTGLGFEKFYGFIGAETSQWRPAVFDGTKPIEPYLGNPDYNFDYDMADRAIEWVRNQKAVAPDKPFFLYYAPGATHSPHQPKKEWIAKYKGKFDQGWDKVREETLARQIALGVVPAGTKLAPKADAIPDWDKLSPAEQTLFKHQAEVFAAFVDYTDHHIGRLIQSVEDAGQLDNTLIFYIAGDNGTSGEGGRNGMFNEYTYFNGVPEKVDEMLKVIDKWGGPETYPHMAAGWSVAFNAPFGWMKQMASDFGGTRNGMVVHWPKRIKTKGEVRAQFGHVIDVAPTVLEAAGLPEPKLVNGTPQIPMQGTSIIYSFDDAKAAERHRTQYFEISGNRAIYHDGWFARTIHKAPWETKGRHPFNEDVWQLFNVKDDFSLARDVAAANPDKLKELQARFLKEAETNHVLPLDDRMFERAIAADVGRPDLMAGRTSITLAEGMTGMMENTFLSVKNKSSTITAEIEVPEAGANGTLIAQGGRFGGWSLYVKDGVPAYDYNFLGLSRNTIAATTKLKPGKAVIRYEFTYAGGGPGKGGKGVITVNGEKVAEGVIDHTQAAIFSADETADVGIDLGTPVVEAIGCEHKSKFTGKIPRITVEVAK